MSDLKPKAIVSWSGGKDCMLALWRARMTFDVLAVLTTVTRPFGRVSMHGIRTELLQRQADTLGIPLKTVELAYPTTNDLYESAMRAAWDSARGQGVQSVICGDLFLEDIRRYREERLFGKEACVFPLWGRPTLEVAREFLALGFRAVICCVDTHVLSADWAGREFDEALLDALPAGIDPCGENGEFHTFVYDGPLFKTPIAVERGERVLREERFSYCDLLPLD